ncbi:MAG: histidine N-alpha-methyltransferase [Candidatus Binatia bacterium]|nr:MAG: histidine N-alpha-methyltransferase [Candidatus Binatia bacterium]
MFPLRRFRFNPYLVEVGRKEHRAVDPLFSFERHTGPGFVECLASDARDGLTRTPKELPPKYFYDDRGSRLFDEICETPEYYLTRTEGELLGRVARSILESTRPTQIVELGAGSAKKTRLFFEAWADRGAERTYVPMDVSEGLLLETSRELRRDFPWLRVHAIACDYERHLSVIPPGRSRLVLFLGSTIGNFARGRAVEFLRGLSRVLGPRDFVLVGFDLRKETRILHAAYNDARGLTAEFNRNVLRVLNRYLDADFRLESFEHVAFFDEEKSQIEMHLRSREEQTVRLRRLGLSVRFARGETIRTEISRKFTRPEVESLFGASGFRLEKWYASPGEWFALALGKLANGGK